MRMHPRRWQRAFLTLALGVSAVAATVTPASATASAGGSTACVKTHCVVATGKGASAGSSTTGGQFVGVCEAVADGATLVSVRCSAAGVSKTTTLPGTVGATTITVPTNSLDPVTICWSATGYFANLSGPVETVTTSGCGLAV